MILNGHTLAHSSPGLMKLASHAFKSATNDNEDRFCDAWLPLLWTFDDCHQDLTAIGQQLLGDFGVSFRFFICPDLIDRYAAGQTYFVRRQLKNPHAELLSWDQIGRLHEDGHILGLHGHDHSDFNLMSEAQMVDQHESSIALLKQRLGAQTDSFAPPFGRLEGSKPDAARLQVTVAQRYFSRIYLSDNRLPPKRHQGIYNRRHSEFGNTVFPSLLKGALQSFYRGDLKFS